MVAQEESARHRPHSPLTRTTLAPRRAQDSSTRTTTHNKTHARHRMWVNASARVTWRARDLLK
eukprot:1832755-Rhodomonas_salina.2